VHPRKTSEGEATGPVYVELRMSEIIDGNQEFSGDSSVRGEPTAVNYVYAYIKNYFLSFTLRLMRSARPLRL